MAAYKEYPKHDLSKPFTISAIEGGWFTSYLNAIRRSLDELDLPLSGRLVWRVNKRTCYISKIPPCKESKICSQYPSLVDKVGTYSIGEKVEFDVLREHSYV